MSRFGSSAALLFLAGVTPSVAGPVPVSTAAQLIAAIDGAAPGDVITLAAGIYDISQNLNCDVPGTANAPIVVRSAAPLGALVRFDAVEGFKVSARHWVFEDLDIQGVCAVDSDCEHAFHVFGDADFLAHPPLAPARFQRPGEEQHHRRPVSRRRGDRRQRIRRQRCRARPANPVTKIDVVGGRRWIVRANFIHDFEKVAGRPRLLRRLPQGQLARRPLRAQPGDLRTRPRRRRPPRPLARWRRQQSRVDLRGRHLHAGAPARHPAQQHHRQLPAGRRDLPERGARHADLRQHLDRDHRHRRPIRASSTADIRNNLVSGQIRNRDGGTLDAEQPTSPASRRRSSSSGSPTRSPPISPCSTAPPSSTSRSRSRSCRTTTAGGSADLPRSRCRRIQGTICDTTRRGRTDGPLPRRLRHRRHGQWSGIFPLNARPLGRTRAPARATLLYRRLFLSVEREGLLAPSGASGPRSRRPARGCCTWRSPEGTGRDRVFPVVCTDGRSSRRRKRGRAGCRRRRRRRPSCLPAEKPGRVSRRAPGSARRRGRRPVPTAARVSTRRRVAG